MIRAAIAMAFLFLGGCVLVGLGVLGTIALAWWNTRPRAKPTWCQRTDAHTVHNDYCTRGRNGTGTPR